MGRTLTQMDKRGLVQPFSYEELQIIKAAQSDFWIFLTTVYAASFLDKEFLYSSGDYQPFKLGALHKAWAEIASRYPRWCILAPRLHLKSTILGRGYVFWRLFSEGSDIDALYIGYKRPLAEEHVEALKRDIKKNPYCRLWVDNNPLAKSVIDFTVDFGEQRSDGTPYQWRATVEPEGILAATRGRHPKVVICDDILSDFSNPASSVELAHINDIFDRVILSLPPPGGVLGVVGTPQSLNDVLHRLKDNPSFYFARFRAVKDWENGITIWPEMYDIERLRKIRAEVGPAAFEVEYQLYPRSEVDTFIKSEHLSACFDPSLELYFPREGETFPNEESWPIVGGMDIGKDVHPSHISFFVVTPDDWMVQVYHEFLHKIDYTTQVKIINTAIEYFNPIRFHFDSTRSELDDRGLTKRARGVKFKKNLKASMATLLEKRIVNTYNKLVLGIDTGPGILFAGSADSPQFQSILQINKELKAKGGIEGHGDAFWSNALAVWSWDVGPKFVSVGDASFVTRSTPTMTRISLSCDHDWVAYEIDLPYLPTQVREKCRHCGAVRNKKA
jgi:hypothetical protein